MTDALHLLSGTALGAHIARGDVSALEVTEHFLARIARHNPELWAFVHTAALRARRRARLFDEARSKGRAPAGPLAGVPIGIKDLNLVRLMPVRFGSRAFGPLVAPIDDAIVRRTRRAGMIILGKLATSEFGALPFTEPEHHPPTRNPWDQSRSPGGSSGGTGAAVAAGLLPLGHGSDGGGSIRIPAALCGLFGFKPSAGALPRVHPPERLALATEGPLTHTVDDAAALLAAWADDDRYSGRARVPAGLRVKLITRSSDAGLAPVHPDLLAATEAVARDLEALGHTVEPSEPFAIAVEEFLVLWQKTAAWAPIPARREATLQNVTAWLRQAGKSVTTEQAFAIKASLQERIAAWWGEADLVLTPTVASLPPEVGSWRSPDPETSFLCAVPYGAFTAIFNVSGQPAINIPVRVPAQPLPLGVQLVARVDDDARLLALARQLEEARGGFAFWPDRYRAG